MAKQFGGSIDQREQIRDAIDIVDLVERYVPLRRQGGLFVGKCPWHDDSHPSMQVNPTRQTFKCWVCNIGGDVFSFIMKIENCDFKEGMQILADMAGIELIKRPKRVAGPPQRKRIAAPDVAQNSGPVDFETAMAEAEEEARNLAESGYDPGYDSGYESYVPAQPTWIPKEIQKSDLYTAMNWLAQKYREAFLKLPEAEEARRYVADRGISEKASEQYLIGYAPLAYNSTLEWIKYDRNRVRILEEAGVLAYRENYDARGRALPRPPVPQTPCLTPDEQRRYYDRFRGRLMFPIRDVQDRVVAFGGRLLPNTTLKSPAKYVNSPETPIFTKSKMLYGLDRARHAITKSRLVLVTEGYTDCIVTAQFGFENVVAVLGTALGSEHVRILKRFADKMILLLDGDGPGQKRAKEVLRFFVEQGVDMSVLTLPDDNDPCEFLLEKGPNAFRELLAHGTVDALDHAFNTTTAGIDLDVDVIESAKALDSLLDVVALFDAGGKASDDAARVRQLKTIQRFATRFRLSEQEIRRQLAEKHAKSVAYAQRNEEREARYEQLERDRDRGQNNAPAPIDAEEERVKAFRRQYVYPIACQEDESDEGLRSMFPPFERSAWGDSRFMPNALEIEYLEILVASPALYPRLVAKIRNEALRSPIARQLDLVARDCLELGVEPTFDRLVLRYEDDSMKSFLIELDTNVRQKDLVNRLADPESREAILRDVFAAFDRLRSKREDPKHLGELRDSETSPEEKLSVLLQIQQTAQARQRYRGVSPVILDAPKPPENDAL